jgi:predicted peptidase
MVAPIALHAESRQTSAELPAEIAAKTDNLNSKFWVYLPKRYEASKAKMPVIIYLHGSSRRGTDLERVKANGLAHLVDTRDDFEFAVVSPQAGYKYAWQQCWRAADIKLVVEHVLKTWRFDPERVYISGLSMGGYGVWTCGAANPELYAAAVPICGGGSPANAAKYASLPIWAFHGEEDYVVPISRSRAMVDAIKKAGGNARLTAYPEVGHNSYEKAYADPELYRWLLKHKRRNP